jgi:malate/lactate dehydrogenase
VLPILHLNGCKISNPTFVAAILQSVLEGEFGLNGVSLGVPCILSRNGVERVLQVTLPPDEQSALVKSASILREVIEQLELAVAS